MKPPLRKTSCTLGLLVLGANLGFGTPQCPTSEHKLIASDGAKGDAFGFSVALSDDVALIGAIMDDDAGEGSGSAYIYRFDGIHWIEEQKLIASDGAAGDQAGFKVSVSGDVAVIGSILDDDAGGGSGSAYVFRFNGASWVQEQKLTASDGAAGDHFGNAVCVSGDVVLIGTPESDDAGGSSGSAYLYRFNGTSWIEAQKLTASDAAAGDGFGFAVSLNGDVALVGAVVDDGAGFDAGAAYVFRFDGTSWQEEQKLTASDAASGDWFGWDVAVDGQVALIGTFPPSPSSGFAYVYRFDGTSWVEEQKLVASDGAAGDDFGFAVSVRDDRALVGALGDDDAGGGSGSAYIYRFNGTNWLQEQKLTASDASVNDHFGRSVSLGRYAALIGATIVNGVEKGAAYVFDFNRARSTNYGTGWPGTNGIPHLTATSEPVIGSPMTVDIGNSAGSDAGGFLVLGLASTDLPTVFGGRLLVLPFAVLSLAIPAAGLSVAGLIPDDPALCGVATFLQVLELDSGAAKGVSFTPGLRLNLGSS